MWITKKTFQGIGLQKRNLKKLENKVLKNYKCSASITNWETRVNWSDNNRLTLLKDDKILLKIFEFQLKYADGQTFFFFNLLL